MRLIALVALAVILAASATLTQEQSRDGFSKASSQILGVLKSEFQKRNPVIDRVELFDVRPLLLNPIDYPEKPNHYLIVARGVRADLTFHGKWDDELIGLFLLDDSLRNVKHVVALLPTQHWGDFIVKVVKVRKDSVTVRGFDFQKGDTTEFVRRYSLRK